MVVLGGWEYVNNTPPSKARWFGSTITEEQCPWLFERGHGSHTIASSELMGTLLAVHLFLDKPASGKLERGTLVCSGATDNQSNSHAVKRYMTTKQPLAAALMQLATELSSRRMWLDLRWTPRELNTEADDITNEIYDKFDPNRRLPITWEIWPEDVTELVLQHYSDLEDEVWVRRIS